MALSLVFMVFRSHATEIICQKSWLSLAEASASGIGHQVASVNTGIYIDCIPQKNSYVEVVTPNTLECDLIW